MIKIKTINLQLIDNKAVVTNDPVYIEHGEPIEFVILNPGGELFFSTGDKNTRITDAKFTMSYEELKSLKKFNIIQKGGNIYPDIYEVTGLKLHDITVIGATVDERYPDVINNLYREIDLLKKAVIDLYDKQAKKEKEGVIE